MQGRGAREQQLEVIVDLGHGADGRARGAHRVDLIDRDRRRNALDAGDVRLVAAIQELAGVGREGLDVAPLAFGVQRVEHQRGLAGAGHAGDHDQFAVRQFQIEILQIVLAGATDNDGLCGARIHRFILPSVSYNGASSRGTIHDRCRRRRPFHCAG